MITPAIILVKPQLPQNIGTSARAMLNFGIQDLRLVSPPADWLNMNTRALSAGADVVLENAKIFERVEEAVADLHLIYATTARTRDMSQTIITPKQLAKEVFSLKKQAKVGILFGPEKCGLENDIVALANGVINISVNPDFSSINLAQSVLLVAYEWFQAFHSREASYFRKGRSALATKEEMIDFLTQLETELKKAGYFRTAHKHPVMVRNLNNIFSRTIYTSQEIRTLRGVVSTLVNPNGIYSRKSKRKNKQIDKSHKII
jgi:tRNA/rRNA methyltransferase